MKTVWIIECMSSAPYENGTWICSVFDNEEKALTHLRELESKGYAEDYIYTLHQWELQ
jgi:hypothetical protein